MDKIFQILCPIMDSRQVVKIILADRRRKSSECRKITLRPVDIKGEYMYQAEFHYDRKVLHRNIPVYQTADFILDNIREEFRQMNILTPSEDIQILASRPDSPRITSHGSVHRPQGLTHDRKKSYIIDNGKPCAFLQELGVMSEDGRVFRKHYSKFRQINRFLEIADDCFGYLPRDRRLRIIDFGCGKSYLTFALYHYLKVIKGRDVEITGLDLKEDVIRFCSRTAEKLGYDDLHFLTGDIADYESDGADMVVTLHACDTATDHALINAVRWNSRVILSVPCCQHELFRQIRSDINEPILKHGIIKDKFTELLTDGVRGLKLESAGYDVSMIEFTSLEHTSKNIMIKAVRSDSSTAASRRKAEAEYQALKEFYHISPAIDIL